MYQDDLSAAKIMAFTVAAVAVAILTVVLTLMTFGG